MITFIISTIFFFRHKPFFRQVLFPYRPSFNSFFFQALFCFFSLHARHLLRPSLYTTFSISHMPSVFFILSLLELLSVFLLLPRQEATSASSPSAHVFPSLLLYFLLRATSVCTSQFRQATSREPKAPSN